MQAEVFQHLEHRDATRREGVRERVDLVGVLVAQVEEVVLQPSQFGISGAACDASLRLAQVVQIQDFLLMGSVDVMKILSKLMNMNVFKIKI